MNIGNVESGELVRRTLTVENSCAGPVKVQQITMSCGCTTVTGLQFPTLIEPHGRLTFDVDIDTLRSPGPMFSTIDIVGDLQKPVATTTLVLTVTRKLACFWKESSQVLELNSAAGSTDVDAILVVSTSENTKPRIQNIKIAGFPDLPCKIEETPSCGQIDNNRVSYEFRAQLGLPGEGSGESIGSDVIPLILMVNGKEVSVPLRLPKTPAKPVTPESESMLLGILPASHSFERTIRCRIQTNGVLTVVTPTKWIKPEITKDSMDTAKITISGTAPSSPTFIESAIEVYESGSRILEIPILGTVK